MAPKGIVIGIATGGRLSKIMQNTHPVGFTAEVQESGTGLGLSSISERAGSTSLKSYRQVNGAEQNRTCIHMMCLGPRCLYCVVFIVRSIYFGSKGT